jgi:hypothetical protein
MRRLLAALSVFYCFISCAIVSHAQEENMNIPDFPEKNPGMEKIHSRWRPGIQGGMNASVYSSDPSVESSSRVGFIAGLQIEYRFSQVLFFQQELRVVQKGFGYNLDTGGSIINFDARVAYLEIPFLVKAKFYQDSIIQPFIFAGPNLGFNIGSNVDVSSGGNTVAGPSLTVLFKTIDFGIDGGLGGEYHFAQRMAGFLAFRTSIGLVNVSSLAGTNWKSRNYQFIFGGFFDL